MSLRKFESLLIQFGKHRGSTFGSVWENDKNYCKWVLQHTDSITHPETNYAKFYRYLVQMNTQHTKPLLTREKVPFVADPMHIFDKPLQFEYIDENGKLKTYEEE